MQLTLGMVGQEKQDRTKLNRTLYTAFRNSVLFRDNYTCQKCGATKKLEVHHMTPYYMEPVGAFLISNGVTLCFECHRAKGSGLHSIYGKDADEIDCIEYLTESCYDHIIFKSDLVSYLQQDIDTLEMEIEVEDEFKDLSKINTLKNNFKKIEKS